MSRDQRLELILQVKTDHNNWTVLKYLQQLLQTLFDEGESFSGKRPFGDSNWEFDLIVALVKAGYLTGYLDSDQEYLEEYDDKEWNKLRTEIIDYVFNR